MKKAAYYHSVTLDESLCRGCTNCISYCPTEAIRVRHGKASIITDRCIDCGECIRNCPAKAKRAASDPLAVLDKFDFKVALPSPSLYGQFRDIKGPEYVLTALLEAGFDDVYEVARAAEVVAIATRRIIDSGNYPSPLISSSCPAVVRLIQVRFPALIEHVIKIQSPMEVAARIVKSYKHKGENVGVFFISPCPAKVTVVRSPIGDEKSYVDGVISASNLYLKLRSIIKKIKFPVRYSNASGLGIGWAHSDGESDSVGAPRSISVDGIHQVIKVLEQIEAEGISGIDFIEAMACPGGCVGGTLNVENPFIAKSMVKELVRKNTNPSPGDEVFSRPGFDLNWTKEIYSKPIMKLDEDMKVAIKMMENLEKIEAELPGLDCGACGAPTCRTLAEDIVRGIGEKSDCIFVLKDEIRNAAKLMKNLSKRMSTSVSTVLEIDDNKQKEPKT